MQTYFLSAALVCVVVGVIHSVLGEVMIFKKLRRSGLIPTEPAPPLQSRHVRILWATWHPASVFGFGFAIILYSAAVGKTSLDLIAISALVVGFVGGSALVLFATRGRPPGWVGLLAVAVLVYLGGIS